MKETMLIAPIIYKFRASWVSWAGTNLSGFSSKSHTLCFLSSLTLRLLFPAWCSCVCSSAWDLPLVVTLHLKLHTELQLLWDGCLCRGGCGPRASQMLSSLGLPKFRDSMCSLCQPQVALQELGLGRELLLLSVTTGHNLHMHSVDATSKHKIIESSDWKKWPKFIAK